MCSPAAAAVYDEQDGDFLFTRGSKRQKTEKTKDAPPLPPPKEPEPAPAPTPALVVQRPRGRPSIGKKRDASPPPQKEETAPKTTSKRPTRRKLDSSPPPAPEELRPAPKKRATRKTRSSTDKATEEEPDEEPEPAPASASRANGARSAKKDSSIRKVSGKTSTRKKQAAPAPVEEDDDTLGTPENSVHRTIERDLNATKIALPFSDTPINNRNKEFRKKGGKGAGGGRRSSMSMRGRRASSLIDNGQSAIPHREVGEDQFFKHIEAEGLSEPRRMKQLLTWCGERALSEKPAHGTSGAGAVLGGKCSGGTRGRFVVAGWNFY